MRSEGSGSSRSAGFVSSVLKTFKRHKRAAQVVVLGLVAMFLGASVIKSWNTLTHYSWQVHWQLLVLAFLLLVGQQVSFGFIWRGILLRMGYSLHAVTSQRIYLGSEFVRYIPGNVWHVITRMLWAERYNIPKSVGFASMVIELATKITSAALVFAISLFFWTDVHTLTTSISPEAVISIAAVGIPLLLLGMKPSILRGALNFGLRKLGREQVAFSLTYRDVIAVTIYWGLSWVVAGAGFTVLMLALVPESASLATFAIALGIYALAWDIGFLSFITPSGLGVREAVIAFLLSAAFFGLTPAGAALGTVIALLARLLSTGSEIICIAVAQAAWGSLRISDDAAGERPVGAKVEE